MPEDADLRYRRRRVARNGLYHAVKAAMEAGLSGEDVMDEVADLIERVNEPEVSPMGPETDRGGLIGQQPY